MPVYQYEGKHYSLPDGLSNEQAIAKIEGFLGKASSPKEAPKQPQKDTVAYDPKDDSPFMDTVKDVGHTMFGAGSPIARFVKGSVVDPLLSVNQILANTGLFGNDIKQGANQLVNSYEQATEDDRAARGSTGFDPIQLAGNVISPMNKVTGALTAPAAAVKGILPAAVRAAGTGAVLASTQPVRTNEQGTDYAEKKLTQMATGAVLGPVTEVGVKVLGKVAGIIKGLTPTGRQEAMQKYLNGLSGDDRTRVIEALRDAKEHVTGSRPTAAEALSDVPSAVELLKLQQELSKKTGVAGKFVTRTEEQQAARVRALQGIAGTDAERAALAAERNSVTGVMREDALNQADEAGPIFTKLEQEIHQKFASKVNALQDAGKTATTAAEQTNLANTYTPVPGFPRFPGRYTHMAERAGEFDDTAKVFTEVAKQRQNEIDLRKFQLKSLEDNGFFPLRANDLVSKLDAAIKGTVSDESKLVLEGVKKKILEKADENGILNSRDLYENVRKTINQDIAVYLGQGERFASGGIPQQAAKAGENVKKFIDAALDKSSDGLWSKYLSQYADYSARLNRMEIGDYLAKRLQTPLDKERAGVFATAVENAAGTIKKATGIPRYDSLGKVLSPEEVSTVNNVLADLSRKSKSEELAKKVGQLSDGLPDPTSGTPDFLSRTVTLAKAAVRSLQQGNQKAFNEKLSQLMLEPSEMAKFMTTAIPKSRLGAFTEVMMKNMDEPTRAAFIQAFTVPAVAQEVGK
jgi:hypothetical protein